MDIIKGDNYEAGLWSMRNVEAMVRDGNVVNLKEEWYPISEILDKHGMYLILIPMDEINDLVLLACYNEYMDAWIDMSGRSVESIHVTHFMPYKKPSIAIHKPEGEK